MVKNLLTKWGTRVPTLGQKDLLEKDMATHSSILAWRIPWTEELGRLYSPWGRKESDKTERLTWTGTGTRARAHTHTFVKLTCQISSNFQQLEYHQKCLSFRVRGGQDSLYTQVCQISLLPYCSFYFYHSISPLPSLSLLPSPFFCSLPLFPSLLYLSFKIGVKFTFTEQIKTDCVTIVKHFTNKDIITWEMLLLFQN